MDVMKMLEDLNPSPKVMRYIIVILVGLLSGSFVYQQYFTEKTVQKPIVIASDPYVVSLTREILALKEERKTIVSRLDYLDTKYMKAVNELQVYTDKRIELVVTRSKKGTDYVIDLLELTKRQLINKEELQPLVLENSAPYEIVKEDTIKEKPKAVVLHDVKPVDNNDAVKDTTVAEKEWFFKRWFKRTKEEGTE